MDTIKKIDNNKLEVIETQTIEKRKVYSYDLILNKIGELEGKLERWKDLKKEADKLKLIR